MINANKFRTLKMFSQSSRVSRLLAVFFLSVFVIISLIWLAPLSYKFSQQSTGTSSFQKGNEVENSQGLRAALGEVLSKLREMKINSGGVIEEASMLAVTTPLNINGTSTLATPAVVEVFTYINYDWDIQLELPRNLKIISTSQEKIILAGEEKKEIVIRRDMVTDDSEVEGSGWYWLATSSAVRGEFVFFKNNLLAKERAVMVKSPYKYSFEYTPLGLANQAEYKNIIFSFKNL